VTSNCSSTTTVDTGDTLACLCKGKGGNPAPANVTWYDKDGVPISGTGKEEKTVTFSTVDRNNMGRYKCIAKNHELAQNETSFELIVNCKYVIDAQIRHHIFETIFKKYYCRRSACMTLSVIRPCIYV
jgi:hypothetical protein